MSALADPEVRYLAVSPRIRAVLCEVLCTEIGDLRRKAREARDRGRRRSLENRADELRDLARELGR